MRERLRSALDDPACGEAAWRDLAALCALGGRFAGSPSEAAAIEYLRAALAAIGEPVVSQPIAYAGWERVASGLEHAGRRYACESLVRSPPTPPGGLTAEVLDLGRGAEADFARAGDGLAGRIALVRHEYMFTAHTLHRRRKYGWAVERGAAGFLIASHLPGELPVTGSSGATPDDGIPAAGISAETAAALFAGGETRPRVRLCVEVRTGPARTENLALDLPGRGAGHVVLSAHIDGHHLAESAMDNATGLAAVLAAARLLAPLCRDLPRGLRILLFSVEEWALAGSRDYVAGLSAAERDAIACVLNLDSVAGHGDLTALTSGYPALAALLQRTARAEGLRLATHAPLMANSDHYNFAVNGIPAARLVAGFDRPESNLRYVLTAGDTLDRVTRAQMANAVRLTAALALAACQATDVDLRAGAAPVP